MKKKVISYKNLPSKLPTSMGLLWWIALDHWNAPQWLYGVAGAVWLLFFIASVVVLVTQETVDVFNKTK